MKRMMFALVLCACEPLDIQSVQSEESCEFEYAVPVPYQGCNKIVGEFRVARYDIEKQECVLSDLTYSCVGSSEEVYVVGSHSVEEVEALVANSCAVCDGAFYKVK